MNLCDVVLAFASAILAVSHAHSGHDHAAPPGGQVEGFHQAGQNEQHIKDHMRNEMNTEKQMSPQELEFHYFRLHDVNNDTMLDGLEILQALTHMLPPDTLQPQETAGKTESQIDAMKRDRHQLMFKNYVDIIDKVLRDDDIDTDGYLSYVEYVMARRRDEQRMRMQHEEMMRQAGPMAYQQGYQQPPAGYQQPPPGYQQPPPGYQQPPPGVPPQTYQQAPPQGYQQPPQGYQQPPQGYQQPPQGYQQPPHGYQQPPPGVPPQNYQQPPPQQPVAK